MQFSELDLSRECQQVVKAPACSQVCSVPIITLTGCVLSRREEKTGLFCCCYWRPVVLSLCVTISVGRFTSTHHVLWERDSVVDTLLVPLRKIWFWSNTNSEVAWALSVCAGRMLIGILFKVTPKVFWQRGCLWVIHVFGDTNINDAVKVALLPFCEIPCPPGFGCFMGICFGEEALLWMVVVGFGLFLPLYVHLGLFLWAWAPVPFRLPSHNCAVLNGRRMPVQEPRICSRL